MFKKKLMLFLIFIIAIGSVVAYESIQVDNVDTDCVDSYGSYKYSADYNITGITSNDLKSVTYFYFKNGTVLNSTKMLYTSDDDICKVSASCYLGSKIDVDHIEIVVYDNDTVIFNETKEFKMPVEEDTQTSSDTQTTTESPAHTYVGSCNSNKFHEPGCSKAAKIKAANKVTFSSRDEAVNSGYIPCKVCSP